MSKFKDYANEMKKNVCEKKSKGYSKTELVGLTHAMLNDPDAEFTEIVKKDDKPEAKVSKPSKELRKSLEPTLISIGLDKDEAKEAVEKMEFSKKTAEAMVNMNDAILKTYLDSGRKYTLPMTSPSETKMSFIEDVAPEKIKDTTKPVTDETGKTTMVPTGKTVKTSKRNVLKAKNAVPPWLKSEI